MFAENQYLLLFSFSSFAGEDVWDGDNGVVEKPLREDLLCPPVLHSGGDTVTRYRLWRQNVVLQEKTG